MKLVGEGLQVELIGEKLKVGRRSCYLRVGG